MAVWQFSVNFIPNSWAMENSYNSSLLYDEDGYNVCDIAWINREPESDFKSVLSNILPSAESWNEDLLFWGDEEGHDIQVWLENEKVEGIQIRLDLNHNLNLLIIKIIKAAKELNCALFFPEIRLLIQANEFEFKSAILNSNAAKFVKDPKEFLDTISKKT